MNALAGFNRRVPALLVAALAVFTWSTWPVAAQSGAKRPLTYDVYDYWKSIGGPRVSDDGQWFVYSLTSQAEDPQLIVRNLKSGQEFKQPRGTGGQFTPDSKFLIYTIPAPRAEHDNNAQNAEGGAPAAAPAAGATPPAGGQAGGQNAQQSRTSVGIMTLATGQVATVEQISSFRLPAESSTWLALQKGRAGGGGGAGRGGGRGGGQGGGG